MPVSTAKLPQLVNLIREKFEGANVARCCVLIGAGCSYNSKIPLGGGIVELLRMEAFRHDYVVESTNWPLENADEYRKQFDQYLDAKNLRVEFDAFCEAGQVQLQQQIDGLIPEIRKSRLPLEVQKKKQDEQDTFFEEKRAEFYQDAQYEYWFSRYSENASDRQRFVERVIDGKDTGYGYVTLASLMAEGYVRNVFTTNFDDLLHDALMLFFNERVKVYAHSDLSDFLNLRDKKPNIIKLHGDFRYQDIRNTSFEIDETRNRLSEKLSDALSETPCFNLVVIGYGGADVSILNQLQNAKIRNQQSPFRLIWTDRKPFEQLHWRVRHLLETTRNNFFIQIDSFDLLMLQLGQALQLKPVQIVDKAKERQREIDLYYGQMSSKVADANLPREDKKSLQEFLEATILFEQASKSENLEEQCQLYEQAVRLKPDFSDALNNWGFTLAKLEQHEEAIEKYRQALLIKPDHAYALVNWGVALANLEQYEEAIDKFKQTLRLKPNYVEAIYNWGSALSDLKRHEEAIQKYQQALQLKPDFYEALNSWGVTLGKLQQYEEAIEKFKQAQHLKPDCAEVIYNWGSALSDLKRHEEAIQKYQQALQLKPDFYEALNSWGVTLGKLQQYEEAIEKFEQVLQHKPEHADALNNWGFALYNMKRHEEAIIQYKHALQIRPDHLNAIINTACAYAMITNIPETMRYLNKWREADASASVNSINSDSTFDGIREDPAFQQYLQNW